MKHMNQFCAVLSFIISLFFATTSGANISYKVHKGDTLQRISKKYNVSISEIKESNRLQSSKLSIGTRLSLPDSERKHWKKETYHNAKKGSSRHFVSNKSASGNNATFHIVKKGDTLKSIAKKYRVTVNDLRRTNHLKSAKLKTGQQILINARSHAPNTYTAIKGDTVRKVAKLFKMNSDVLRELNGLKGNALKPGQELLLAKINSDIKEDPVETGGIYAENTGPAITSARLEEVKELSTSEDMLADLSIQERLILFAKKMLHLPYRFGGNGTFGLDCSAYVQKVYGFIGLDIPRSAREQFNFGESVDKEDMTVGDLVFFRTYASFPSHVGIYLGNNLFIHASSLSRKVTIDSLESPYYFRHFIGAKRIIPEDDFDIGSGETQLNAN
ncbi:MAG: LysM peptidoglycan-binding domain-containing protein [Dissulfurispiraceae bacterium]|jgi:cell wall-associated NlpC family hydrolase